MNKNLDLVDKGLLEPQLTVWGGIKQGSVEIGEKLIDQSGNCSFSKEVQSSNSIVKDTLLGNGNQIQNLAHEIEEPMMQVAEEQPMVLKNNVENLNPKYNNRWNKRACYATETIHNPSLMPFGTKKRPQAKTSRQNTEHQVSKSTKKLRITTTFDLQQ